MEKYKQMYELVEKLTQENIQLKERQKQMEEEMEQFKIRQNRHGQTIKELSEGYTQLVYK